MRISHAPIVVDDETHDVSHLNRFVAHLAGKGRDPGSNLRLEILMSCHIYTQRCTHQQTADRYDYRQNPRRFCIDRYNLSLALPGLIQGAISADAISFEVNDYNETSNLALFDLDNGQNYHVVYYFEPSRDQECDIKMNILSAYQKHVANRPKGNKMSYFARQSMFKERRIP